MPALATVEQHRQRLRDTGWFHVNESVGRLVEKTADVAVDLRQRSPNFYTSVPLGYHYNPDLDQLGIFKTAGATEQDFELCRLAASPIREVRDDPLTVKEATGDWVKVAYSPTLRRVGEYLNFFPGKYPGGIPNWPGPIQSMLTSGLVGAGLGYGAGWLGEKLLPDRWRRGKLRRLLAVIGGGVGALPGALWTYTNVARGKPFYDSSALNHPAADYSSAQLPDYPRSSPFRPPPSWEQLSDAPVAAQSENLIRGETELPTDRSKIGMYTEAYEALPGELGERYKAQAEKVGRDLELQIDGMLKEAIGTFGPTEFAPRRRPGPLDINVNSLGQVLWDVGTTPGTAAMTMGALHAAQQMPGGRESSDWVTPSQMARLGASMGVGYVSGGLVGSALGMLTGMPQGTQDRLKETGMYLGIVKSVVPKLFGQ
jgi:hypothetical protein